MSRLRTSRLWTCSAAAGAMLLVIAAGPGAPAAPPRNAAANLEAPGSDVASWVRDLRSPVFKTRDSATAALLRLPPARLGEIEQALARETDDEAAARLQQVAVHLYLRGSTPMVGDVGMLGIALAIEPVQLPGRTDQTSAVAVTELQPGFPAEEFLKAGDRLVALNNQAFPADLEVTTFREIINASPPGSLLHLTVVRNGRLLKVGVPLAGIPSNLPLVNFVDSRREALQQYVAHHPSAVAQSRAEEPLVLPDPQRSNDIQIQIIPAGAPFPGAINPPDIGP